MAKVSVLVPVYNAERYLCQCLDSVCRQTLEDMEIICINDGSTDSSPVILERYAAQDRRVVIINKPNTGYGHSMNMGIKAAHGEYIGIVESDDFVEEEMFKDLYQAASQCNSEIVKSNYWYYWNDRGDSFQELFPKLPYETNFTPREHPLIFSGTVYLWTGIYRKEFLTSNDIWFLESTGASFQDVGFTVKTTACSKKMQLIPTAYYHYRQDNENSSVHSKEKVFCVADEYREVWRYLSAHRDVMDAVKYAIPPSQFQRLKESFGRIDNAYKWDFIARLEKDFAALDKEGLLKKEYWTEEQWNLLQHFGQSYCRELAERKKRQLMRQGLLALISKSSRLYIYGAGIRGKAVCEYLQGNQLPVSGFIITEKNESGQSPFNLPVMSIDHAKIGEGDMILIAIKSPGLYEAIRELETHGITNYIAVDEELYKALREDRQS